MAKPILITRIPKTTTLDLSSAKIYEYLKFSAPDYNHIVMFENTVKKVTFEVHNLQDYKQIDFKKLKEQLCKENIKSQK